MKSLAYLSIALALTLLMGCTAVIPRPTVRFVAPEYGHRSVRPAVGRTGRH